MYYDCVLCRGKQSSAYFINHVFDAPVMKGHKSFFKLNLLRPFHYWDVVLWCYQIGYLRIESDFESYLGSHV